MRQTKEVASEFINKVMAEISSGREVSIPYWTERVAELLRRDRDETIDFARAAVRLVSRPSPAIIDAKLADVGVAVRSDHPSGFYNLLQPPAKIKKKKP